jgi:hypothetical protein
MHRAGFAVTVLVQGEVERVNGLGTQVFKGLESFHAGRLVLIKLNGTHCNEF